MTVTGYIPIIDLPCLSTAPAEPQARISAMPKHRAMKPRGRLCMVTLLRRWEPNLSPAGVSMAFVHRETAA